MQTLAHRIHRSAVLGSPRPALLLAAVTLACLVPGCGRPPGQGGPETQAAGGARMREVPQVRVVTLERREMTQVLETMTKLESEREIQLFPLTTGTVVDVFAEEGDEVAAGEILAAFDERDQVLAVRDAQVALDEARNSAELGKLAVDEAKARMDNADLSAKQAERDYERNVKLFEGRTATSSLSKSALEASELERDRANHDLRLASLSWQKSQLDEKAFATAVERAKVALDRAQVSLSHCKLIAPFAGVIAERRIRVGDIANAATASFVLTDTENLRTVFRRPQEEFGMFQSAGDGGSAGAALAVTATAEALPGEVFTGEVERVSPTIDQASGQFRVTARLHPEDLDGGSRLLPGMLVRLEIVTDRHPEALVVPKRALRREGERRYVFVVEDRDSPPKQTEAGSDPAGELPAPTAKDGVAAAEKDAPLRSKSVCTIRRVDIVEGYADDDFVEIAALGDDALAAGAVIVLVGSRDLDDGDLVDIGGKDEPAEEDPAATETGKALADADESSAPAEGTNGTER